MTATLRTLLVAGVVATAGLAVLRADVLSDLGIAAAEAPHLAVQAATEGSLPWAAAQRFKTAATAQKVALVKGAVAWAKIFTASPAFASAYATARDEMKPAPPADALGLDDTVKQQIAQIDRSEAEMKKQLAGQPAMLKQLLDQLEASRAQTLAMAKNAEMQKAFANRGVEAKKHYAATLVEFDQKHPPDPRAAVAVQLHRFLDVCRDVDFGAQLTDSSGGRRFVNPAYEQKSSEWKMCFRAGKEPVEAARALAEAWLRELGR